LTAKFTGHFSPRVPVDHVIIDAREKNVVEDVRAVRGSNCDLDHFWSTQTNADKRIKRNKRNLQNANNLNQYRTCLYIKLNEQLMQQNIEEEWAHIKQTIIESANESIQKQNTPLRNE
jgi:hypothetical protein